MSIAEIESNTKRKIALQPDDISDFYNSKKLKGEVALYGSYVKI